MSSWPKPAITPEQYLDIETAAKEKSEYYRGEMFAMAGGSEPHSLLAVALSVSVSNRVDRNRCAIFNSDMRLLVKATGLFTYPDFTVVCGQREYADERRSTLLNPTVLGEVLSPSTETYDRTDKFAHYRTMESLRQYVLVSQDRMLVEVFTRRGDKWDFAAASAPGDLIQLISIQVEIPIQELYLGIEVQASARWPRASTT